MKNSNILQSKLGGIKLNNISFNSLVEEIIKAYGRKDGKIQLQKEMIDALLSAQNALKFYANEDNYDYPLCKCNDNGEYSDLEVNKDNGAIARVALEL